MYFKDIYPGYYWPPTGCLCCIEPPMIALEIIKVGIFLFLQISGMANGPEFNHCIYIYIYIYYLSLYIWQTCSLIYVTCSVYATNVLSDHNRCFPNSYWAIGHIFNRLKIKLDKILVYLITHNFRLRFRLNAFCSRSCNLMYSISELNIYGTT